MKKLTQNGFIEKALKVYGNKYNYSLVEYKSARTNIKIICSIHGEFEQTAGDHLHGLGCSKCAKHHKLTQDEFMEKAKKVHGDKYDYSQTEYINARTNIRVVCPIHGEFITNPFTHLRKCGCPKCGKKYDKKQHSDKKFLKNRFIEKANKIHNNKYNYSLVEYIDSYIKIKIVCPIHGEFEQTPAAHSHGQGCPKCRGDAISKKKMSSQEDWIKKVKLKHGDKYDYSLVEYTGSINKVKIICPKHGVFLQEPRKHTHGHGCPRCQYANMGYTNEEFAELSNKIHHNKYDYSLVDYHGLNTKVKIICPIHGEFEQKPSNHLVGKGCQKCKSSKGEARIRLFLEQNNIKFIPQKMFKHCRSKSGYMMPFDFYLPEYNLCIEFQGQQHYIPVKIWGGEEKLKYIQEHDKIKKDFCFDNDITLLKIKYNEDIIYKLKRYL
jgi:hypothetical protein